MKASKLSEPPKNWGKREIHIFFQTSQCKISFCPERTARSPPSNANGRAPRPLRATSTPSATLYPKGTNILVTAHSSDRFDHPLGRHSVTLCQVHELASRIQDAE